MGRPDRGTDERRGTFQQYNSNYRPLPVQKPYFEQDYRDVVNLLNEKILNFIRLNPKLRSHIFNRKRFVENKADGIYFNLIEFSEAYRAKFIEPDFEGYCLKFMGLLKPLLLDFTREIGFNGNVYRYYFRLGGRTFDKGQNIMVDTGNGAVE